MPYILSEITEIIKPKVCAGRLTRVYMNPNARGPARKRFVEILFLISILKKCICKCLSESIYLYDCEVMSFP